MFIDFWRGLQRASRIGLVAGGAVIMVFVAGIATYVFRTDYDVLFASLSPADASSMTGELDRMKVPYRLGGDGTTIFVDRSTVHATRLKLMGKDLPLHGAVGFELFNNSDFGMTEFAQKINFQRALQGEITRTILSLSEVESVRVHLAFPEESLFKRDQAKTKASVTLALRRGQSLRADQVSGIQRLVAAAVTGISADDVTIVNQEGVALTRVTLGEPGAAVPARLDLKADIERALSQKVAKVLDKTFGDGRVVASVDVALDMNQVRITTEDVRGQAEKPGETQTGVVVRERETLRDETAVAQSRDGAAGASFRETEYQVGRRVEQVITQPGSIQRIQVVAVVRDALDGAQIAQVKALIGAAVGAMPDRGDTVVVHSMGAFAVSARATVVPTVASMADADDLAAVSSALPPRDSADGRTPAFAMSVAVAVFIALALAGAWAWHASTVRKRALSASPSLQPAEREAALAKLRLWMSDGQAQGGFP